MDFKILGIDVYHILNWFFIYSFIGWVWESSYVSIKERRWVNRGFVTGPLCTIYGFGAVSVYLFLWRISDNLLMLYIGGVVVATIIEYLTAFLMESIFHASWWDYSNEKFNFQGRICLMASLGWGLFTVILFYVLQPLVNMIVGLYSTQTGWTMVAVIVTLHTIDLIISAGAAFALKEKLARMDEIVDEIGEYLQHTKLYESVEELRSKMENLRYNYRINDFQSRYNRRFEGWQTTIKDSFEQHGLGEYKSEFEEKMNAFTGRLRKLFKDGNFQYKRFINAYPNLKTLPRKAKNVAKNKLLRRHKK